MEYDGIKIDDIAPTTPAQQSAAQHTVSALTTWVLKKGILKEEQSVKKVILFLSILFFIAAVVPFLYTLTHFLYPGSSLFRTDAPPDRLPPKAAF